MAGILSVIKAGWSVCANTVDRHKIKAYRLIRLTVLMLTAIQFGAMMQITNNKKTDIEDTSTQSRSTIVAVLAYYILSVVSNSDFYGLPVGNLLVVLRSSVMHN